MNLRLGLKGRVILDHFCIPEMKNMHICIHPHVSHVYCYLHSFTPHVDPLLCAPINICPKLFPCAVEL